MKTFSITVVNSLLQAHATPREKAIKFQDRKLYHYVAYLKIILRN